MAMNISYKFEKASYNIFFVRAVTVKSLYTLRCVLSFRVEVKEVFKLQLTNSTERMS